MTWKQLPSTRSYDIFAGRVTNGQIVRDSHSGSMTSIQRVPSGTDCYYLSDQSFTSTYSNTNGNWNISQPTGYIGYLGVGFTGLLTDHSAMCTNDVGQHFSYVVKYRSSLHFQSQVGATVYVSYQHAQQTVSLNSVKNGYTFGSSGLGGVIIFNNSSYNSIYDGMGGVSITL